MQQFGRKKIYIDAEEINAGNIEQILTEALRVHQENATAIRFLKAYAKGDQPILKRKKKTREDINNKVVVNTAAEMLDFKLSFIFGSPLDIVRASGSENTADISRFIRFMDEQGKDGVDQDVAQDFLTSAFGYRGILPNKRDYESSPFRMMHLLPETTFCAYWNDLYREKAMGVSFIEKKDSVKYTVHTKDKVYTLESSSLDGGIKLLKVEDNPIGEIPIICYEMPDLMGCFEKAISLMDAINTTESNRVDDLEQYVQSILWIAGIDLPDEALTKLKETLCLLTPDVREGTQPQVKYLVNNIDQKGIQGMVDDMYAHILEICGVPGREEQSNGGGSTGVSTEMGGSGWRKVMYSAERIASAWKKADREMYHVALAIMNKFKSKRPAELADLKAIDLETKFSLSKNHNALTKSQSLLNDLKAGIHPRIAIRECDKFPDPEQVYEESKPYLERAAKAMFGELQQEQANEDKKTEDVTNQPNGDEGVTAAVQNKGYVQKPD